MRPEGLQDGGDAQQPLRGLQAGDLGLGDLAAGGLAEELRHRPLAGLLEEEEEEEEEGEGRVN